MKYTKEEQIDIGRRVYTREITHTEAENLYGIGQSTTDRYIHEYKIAAGIPTTTRRDKADSAVLVKNEELPLDIEAYRSMSKEELIDELIKAKVNEARAKKGYEVKGDGASKEYVSLNSRNMK